MRSKAPLKKSLTIWLMESTSVHRAGKPPKSSQTARSQYAPPARLESARAALGLRGSFSTSGLSATDMARFLAIKMVSRGLPRWKATSLAIRGGERETHSKQGRSDSNAQPPVL